jgi:exosortase
MSLTTAGPRPRVLSSIVLVLLPLGCLAWAFGSALTELWAAWHTEEYSHGFLVPPFAVFLLWVRRDKLDVAALRPSLVWGLLLLAAGLGLRLHGAYYHYVASNTTAVVPCIAGLCLLLGGWAAWRWAWPAILFLAFMVPLPWGFSTALSAPLQRIATVSSTFILQVFGLPALAEGNVIQLNDAAINVVEACSGLRMLVVFFALATAVALVIRRPLLDRILIVLSAVPIAVLSNIIRITVTGFLHQTISSETANAFFHDVAGWLMMPLALGLLALELKVFQHLFIEAPARPLRTVRPAVTRGQRPRRVPQPGTAAGTA